MALEEIPSTNGKYTRVISNIQTSDKEDISIINPFPVTNIVDGEPVSKDNPSHFNHTDQAGRVGLNTVFGEQIVGTRIAQVAGQFKYGLKSDEFLIDTTTSGSTSVVESQLVVSTGTDSNGSSSISNRRPIRYIPGHDTYLNWTATFTGTHDSTTGVTTGIDNSSQRTGLFDGADGFFIGFENETFGFTRRRLGVDYFTPIDLEQFAENEGYKLDLTKGNVFRLNYGYLGFAPAILEVMEPTGNWATLFKLEYPNMYDETHITQTFLEPRTEVINNGNTTDVTIKVGSFSAGIIDGGSITPSDRDFSKDVSFDGISGNQTLVAFRSKSNFKSFINKIPVLFSWLSVSVEGAKPFTVELVKNPTENTAGTWTDVNTLDSTIEYSTDTVYDLDGHLSLPMTLSKTGQLNLDIKNQKVEILPNDILVLRLITTSTNYDVTAGIRWKELF